MIFFDNIFIYKLAHHVQPLFVAKELVMEGFIVTRWLDRWMEGIKQNIKYLNEGKLKYREHVVDGFENAPKAFMDLFTGENIGKTVVRVKDHSNLQHNL